MYVDIYIYICFSLKFFHETFIEITLIIFMLCHSSLASLGTWRKKGHSCIYGCKCECSGTPFDRIFIALMNTFLPAFFAR